MRVSQPGRVGPRLTPSRRDCRPGAAEPAPAQPRCGVGLGIDHISAGGVTLAEFADALGRVVARSVVDRTGLAGTFDVEITFNPEQQQHIALAPGVVPPRIDRDAPSIFTAVQEQLGLKLEPSRGPVEVLVIDAVEMATPD